MSGTFERQIYDIKAYETDLKQSVGPLLYRMNPITNDTCVPCRNPEPGFVGKVGVSITHKRPLIDVESDLLGLDIKNSKDPNQHFQPKCPQCGSCMDGYPCGGGIYQGCRNCQETLYNLPKCEFGRDYTLLSNPKCTARELGINRFQPLCMPPQDEERWLQQSNVGINYRMVVKDNHVPCIPKFYDPTPLLPKGKGTIPCPQVDGCCGAYIGPMNKYGKARTSIQHP